MKKVLFTLWTALLSTVVLAQRPVEYYVLPAPADMQIKEGQYKLPDTLRLIERGNETDRQSMELFLGQDFLQELNALYKSELTSTFKVYVSDGAYSSSNVVIFYEHPTGIYANKEYYELKVSETGIYISCGDYRGALYAIQTLKQLLRKQGTQSYLPYCTIKDFPDYPWRGLLLDVCRHFMPISKLYETINTMVACKMNVLHLHLSDDQAFRVECKNLPLLHQKASNGQYYTQEELRQLQHYALLRGIEIIPEFDLPGHTTAWLFAYPEFTSLTIPNGPESGYGVFKPVMDPTNPKLYKHLDIFFREMSMLFVSPYMHIGGDEVRSDDWLNNPRIKKFMDKKGYTTVPQMQDYFNAKVAKILTTYRKKMIGWDEILEGKPAAGTVIQSWRGAGNMHKAVAQGYGVIRSNGFYMDQTYTAGEYYSRFDTITSKKYLGGEGAMWAELVDSNTVNSRLWPNAAAVADIYWRHPVVIDSIAFYKRLYIFMWSRLRATSSDVEVNPTVFTIYQYITPIDGYRRHKMIKAEKAYNTSYQLNTIADKGRPTSMTYVRLLLLLEAYKQNPSAENKSALEDLFNYWIREGGMWGTNKYVRANLELSNCYLSLINCGEAGVLWLNYGESSKARELLAIARKRFEGKEYELNIFRLLETYIKSRGFAL